MTDCPECGAARPAGARFCPECGTQDPDTFVGYEVRKTVTVVFCDVVGSTALGERLDPETQRAVMTRYFVEMRRVLEQHGGRVEKFIGDAVMAVFGVPIVHEDDALRAVRAADGMQRALVDLANELVPLYGVEIAARIGVNTGEVVVGDGVRGSIVTGDPVNTAARIETAAGPGEVLLGDATYRLLRGVIEAAEIPPVDAKGKSEPMRVWRLVSVPEGTGRIRVGGEDATFVGRVRERRLLHDGLDRAIEEHWCQLFVLLGPAGAGKTRLSLEFLAELPPETLVLRGACLSYGEGIAFWPLEEMLRSAAGLVGGESPEFARARLAALLPDSSDRDSIVDRLTPLAGLPGDLANAQDTSAAVRRLLSTLAQKQPLVMVVDDLHWAEPALLDLLASIVELSRDVPLVMVCLARPEFLEAHQGWCAGALNSAVVQLSRLSDADVTALIEDRLPGAPVAPELCAAIAAAAGGNALFVGQLVAMLVDEGRLAIDESGVWSSTTPLDHLDLPPSIGPLLVDRLEQLPATERAIIAAAAVMGTTFYIEALPSLMDSMPLEGPDSHLTQLVRRDLVRSAVSDLDGQEAYRFLHVLIHDAAYSAVPKATRSGMHERFARWLEGVAATTGSDVVDFVGYHLEAAYLLRADLGPLSDATITLGNEASARLTTWAVRVSLVDPQASATLFDRAAALATDPRRRSILAMRAARALYFSADSTGSLTRYDQVERDASEAGDRLMAVTARLSRVDVARGIGEVVDLDELLHAADEAEADPSAGALPELHVAVAAARLEVIAAQGLGYDRQYLVAQQGLSAAAQTDDHRHTEFFLSSMFGALTYGPTPARPALARFSELTASCRLPGGPSPHWSAMRAVLLAMDDQPAQARATLTTALDRLDAAPGQLWAASLLGEAGYAELVIGDQAAAGTYFRRAMAWLEAHGHKDWHATIGASYGVGCLDQIGPIEGQRLLDVSMAGIAPDDATGQATIMALNALLLAKAGRHLDSLQFIEQAGRLMPDSDCLYEDGVFQLNRATVLAAAGDRAEAQSALRTALDRFEAKGDLPDAARTRRRLAELG